MQLVQVFRHFLMPRDNEKTEYLRSDLYFEMIIGFIWTRSKYIYLWFILNPHLCLWASCGTFEQSCGPNRGIS